MQHLIGTLVYWRGRYGNITGTRFQQGEWVVNIHFPATGCDTYGIPLSQVVLD